MLTKYFLHRSIETNLRYTTFIGDGDSKSFSAIQRMKPYGSDVTITKEECVGHVAKRMGTRLRKLRDKMSGMCFAQGILIKMVHVFMLLCLAVSHELIISKS